MRNGNICFLLRFALIFLLAFSVASTVPGEALSRELALDEKEYPLQEPIGEMDDFNIVDCPEELDESIPYRLVLQIIDNVFHKWREYDVSDDGLYIFMEEPHWGALTAEEANELLIASQGWLTQQFVPLEEAITIDPEDLSQLESLMPFTDEPRPECLDDYRSDEPDTSISRSEHLETQDMIDFDGDALTKTETEIVPQHVIGTDERVRVPYSYCTAYPENTIGFVFADYDSGGSRGTGFLISPHTALTNAHVIYNSDLGGWFSELYFAPGQFQAYEGGQVYHPYDYRDAFNAVIPIGYVENEDCTWDSNPYDYGAFFIETPFDGISTFMPLEFDYYPSYINLLGYPAQVLGETNSMAMWHSFGEVIRVLTREIDHLADSTPGTSGAPVFVYNQQTDISRVVGLLAGGTPDFNTGPRLASHNIDLIEEWMQWSPDEELSDDATLLHLEVDPGELFPGFDPGTTEYSVNVAHDIDEVEVTAVLADDNASLSIDGQAVDSGVAEPVALGDPGTDTVTEIEIVAEDGETTKQYTITISREGILETYSLVVTKEGEGTILIDDEEVGLPYTEEYEAGVEVNLEASAGEDWAFEKWVVNGTEHTASGITVTMDKNKTAAAYFEAETDPVPGPAEATYELEEAVLPGFWTITVNEPAGYQFNLEHENLDPVANNEIPGSRGFMLTTAPELVIYDADDEEVGRGAIALEEGPGTINLVPVEPPEEWIIFGEYLIDWQLFQDNPAAAMDVVNNVILAEYGTFPEDSFFNFIGQENRNFHTGLRDDAGAEEALNNITTWYDHDGIKHVID